MNAAETLQQTSAAADQRAYEPSMEEILASIRRIIADDQSLPNRTFVRDGEAALRAALDNPEAPSLTEAAPHVPTPVEAEPASPVAEMPKIIPTIDEERPAALPQTPRLVSAASLGHIAAPQYAMPDTPVRAGPVHREDSGFVPSAPKVEVLPAEPVEAPHVEVSRAAPRRDETVAAEAPAETDATPHPARRQREVEAITPEPETDAMSSLFSTATDQTVTAAFNTLAASRLVENDDALKDMVRDMIRPLLKSWLDDNLPTMVERLVRAEIERVGRGGR